LRFQTWTVTSRAAFTCDAGVLVEDPALAGARIAAPTAA